MSGPNESSPPTSPTVSDLLEDLGRFEKSLGLPPLAGLPETEAASLLGLTRSQVRGMTAEECQSAALDLQRYSFYLQRKLNRSKSVADWAEAMIKDVIAAEVVNVKGYGLEEKRPLAIKNNPVATRLNLLKIRAMSRHDEINYLSVRLEGLAKHFSTMAQIKGRQHG